MDTSSSNLYLKKVYDFLVQAEPDSEIPPCDAIFVFGSNNEDMAKHAALLYLQKKAPRIIVSGLHGLNKIEGPHGFNSEAEYLASIIEKEGVPKENIILDMKATNTYENVIFGIQMCEEKGFNPKNLVLVSVPYLLRRAKACFAKNFSEIKTYGSAYIVPDTFFEPWRIERIKGELSRLIKYAEGGTIIPVVIPEDVKEAANFL
jgi:uncharacterized SAM-binding protein YcdF (DUF218 family)